MPRQPGHDIVEVPPEDPAVFNPSVADMRSQYAGHIGSYWTVVGIQYNGSKRPNEPAAPGSDAVTDQWNPEILNQQHIALVPAVHGQLWGDLAKEYHSEKVTTDPSLLGDQPKVDGIYYQVPEDISPAFYPDGSIVWADCDYTRDDGSGNYTVHTICPNNIAGKAFPDNVQGNLKRYTGSPGKPFMIRQRGDKLWVFSQNSIGWNANDHGSWAVTWGAVLRVADINADPNDQWFDAWSAEPMKGPRWETRYERDDLGLIAARVTPRVSEVAMAAPAMAAHLFGVGREVMVFFDDRTWELNQWRENIFEVITINPYNGTIGQQWQDVGTETQKPGDTFYEWRFIREIAPRDAPWAIGVTHAHHKMWIGVSNNPYTQNDQDDDIALDLRRNPPTLADPDELPWSDFPETEITPPVLIAEGVGIESRGYDRQPENELRGAIDCVIWTEGYTIKSLGDGSAADHAFAVDSYKTRPRVGPPPAITGSYLYRREWEIGGQEVKSVEYYDLSALHEAPHPGLFYNWHVIGLTVTPFGDFVYVMISDTEGTYDRPREFLVVRPGHWEIRTRVPLEGFFGWYDVPEVTPDTANGFGDLTLGTEFTTMHADRCRVKVTSNEHWVYLANFPQRITATYEMRPAYNPSDATFIEPAFQIDERGIKQDGSNLGSSAYLPFYDPVQQSYNVAYEWMIDLHSGQVRVPFRTQYGNFIGGHSIYGASNHIIPDTDWDIDADKYDKFHQNLMGFALTDTPPKVRGTTPTPTLH